MNGESFGLRWFKEHRSVYTRNLILMCNQWSAVLTMLELGFRLSLFPVKHDKGENEFVAKVKSFWKSSTWLGYAWNNLFAACLHRRATNQLPLDKALRARVNTWRRGEQTSVGEPRSAEGLQVLVSGSAVPALLRTGEDGVAPEGASGMLEVCRKMPCLWRRDQVFLQLKKSLDNNWTCTVRGREQQH